MTSLRVTVSKPEITIFFKITENWFCSIATSGKFNGESDGTLYFLSPFSMLGTASIAFFKAQSFISLSDFRQTLMYFAEKPDCMSKFN